MRLVHMHGELAKSRCEDECGRRRLRITPYTRAWTKWGAAHAAARLRPHIVFFGEIPLEMDRIQREIAKATLMVVVGTSGSVYPAANFVHWARQARRADGLRRARAAAECACVYKCGGGQSGGGACRDCLK